MKLRETKCSRRLEEENDRLKKPVADIRLDREMLKARRKNGLNIRDVLRNRTKSLWVRRASPERRFVIV